MALIIPEGQSRIKTSSGPESSFNWRPPPTLKNTCLFMGAQNVFSRGEQNHQHHKNTTIFRRAAGANENSCVFSRCFRPILKVCTVLRAPKARAKILGCFVGKKDMTPFCQIPRDGASAPFPLRVPMCLASWTMFFAANSFFSQPIIGVFGCRRANMAMSAIGFQLPGRGTCYWLQPLQAPMASYLLP